MGIVRYNIGRDGMCSLIAQADTPITLAEWFESDADRSYVVKFSDYCAYISTYGREGFDNLPFARAHRIMEMLTIGKLNIGREEVDDIILSSYKVMIKDIGKLLIKEACLYARNDSDWKPFNIEVSLPVVLLDYFGKTSSVGVDTIVNERRFVDVTPESQFNKLVETPQLMNFLIGRDDITMKDIVSTKDTPMERLLLSGITYLLLHDNNIKGRVIGGV